MIDPPGGIFPQDFNYGLPFIKGINVRFIEVFIYVAFLKALKQKNKFHSVFIRSYQLLLILTVLLLLFTFLLDSSVLSLVIVVKWLFVWSLLYSIPKLISSFDEWIFLFRMAFIIVFIAFVSQLFHMALGYAPAVLLGTNYDPIMIYGEVRANFTPVKSVLNEVRPISSSYIILMAFVGAMFFLKYKRKCFPQIYLYLVIIISYLSILITATRGWFIAFSLVIFIYFAFIQKIKKIAAISIIVTILIPSLLSVPIIRKQLLGSFKRLSTIESVAQGDLSAGGTNARDTYSIDLLKKWEESPVLGWGFSEYFKNYGNGHAGLANMLFSVGIIGYLVFIYFWYKLFFTPVTVNKRISFVNPFKGSLTVFSLAFLILLILHATSGQQFGIYLSFGGEIFSQTLFYCYSSFFITMALNADHILRDQYHKDGEIHGEEINALVPTN
jgi:hypothetical protein